MEDRYPINEPENKARHTLINPALKSAGWEIQHFRNANIHSSKGVAVEYFQLGKSSGEADYVLFVNGMACGIIEAKKVGEGLVAKETQSGGYAKNFPREFMSVGDPLPFVYESTGVETRFTNFWDPKPRSREVFHFHSPDSLERWIKEGQGNTLRCRLRKFPALKNEKLWDVQRDTILNLEKSFSGAKPRALIQMATGSGKTFTAVNICYRLIKDINAKRILFLVDRSNLGTHAQNEFETFVVPDDGRKFSDIYNVQHLSGTKIDSVNRVCISTIQRMYSILKGRKLTEEDEELSDVDKYSLEVDPIEYNPKVPIDEFDFIIVDECHRSIYNLWKQVLDYFDCFLIGLTATPSKETIGFFNRNLVMEYPHEKAVADQVNVDFDVYNIKTKISNEGSVIEAGQVVQKRDLRTRRQRWETLCDEVKYDKDALDKSVVAKDQIRTIVRTFKEKLLTEIFPNRKYVPKTLIFAKDDNHAEEIVKIVREEFDESNKFAVKITYKTEGKKPDELIRQFRNEFYPRIAVTVDMIATGTDIKPLEIVFFMRDVKSRNYFEQMKGRGVRVIGNDKFKEVTPDAPAKERFVIVDAVGVCENENLNDTRPLEQKPKIGFDRLMKALRFGKPNKEVLSSMASRFLRLNKKLGEEHKKEISEITDGVSLVDFANDFISAIDEDEIFAKAQEKFGEKDNYLEYEPKKKELEEVACDRMLRAVQDFSKHTELVTRISDMKREVEQIIDTVSLDEVKESGFSSVSKDKAKSTVSSFRDFIEKNKDELTAISVFYNGGKLCWNDIKELAGRIKVPPYNLTPTKLWDAYSHLTQSKVKGKSKGRVADFVSLLRFELRKVNELEPFNDTVEKKFKAWLERQKSMGVKFSSEELRWLNKMKDSISENVELNAEDFDNVPFNQMGGIGKAVKIFGSERFNKLIEELNEELGI